MINNKQLDNNRIRSSSHSIIKTRTNNLKQSPKISSKKLRNIIIESPINNNKLYSLIDIKDKIFFQKGTKLPKQYERLNEKEFEEIYYKQKFKKIENDNENINNIKKNKNKDNTFKTYSNNNNNRKEIITPQSAKNLILKKQKLNKKKESIPKLNLENIEKNS